MSNIIFKNNTLDASSVYDSTIGKTQAEINASGGGGGGGGVDGYSPVVTITEITGGHRVNITDKTHPQGQNFDVMDGAENLPAIGSGDNGKVLRAVSGSWAASPETTELPNVSAADNGKVLEVSNGAWSAQTPSTKADPSTVLNLTLLANGWSSATPPTQTLAATGVTASNNIIVGIGSSVTSTQYEAACKAGLVCTAQASGTITVSAFDSAPEVDIPIAVMIVG